MRRPDAERAAKEMDGVEWGDNVIKISWGKAVPIAARALYGEYLRRPALGPAEPSADTPVPYRTGTGLGILPRPASWRPSLSSAVEVSIPLSLTDRSARDPPTSQAALSLS